MLKWRPSGDVCSRQGRLPLGWVELMQERGPRWTAAGGKNETEMDEVLAEDGRRQIQIAVVAALNSATVGGGSNYFGTSGT